MKRKPTNKAPSKTPKQLAKRAPLAARPDDQIVTPGVAKFSAEEWARKTEQRPPEMEQRSVREVGPQGARDMPFLKAVPDWFDYVPREVRFFEDWTTASAHRVYAHWALDIRDYEYCGERDVGFILRPLHWPTERLFASEDSSVHMLMDRIGALDREIGLPFGWFFLTTNGYWVTPEVGHAIATALGDQRVRLSQSGLPSALALGRQVLRFLRAPGIMDEIASPALLADPETRRALQLDALSAILPMDRRDRLAQLLTDDDVETLKHLAREGMGENRLRALASDLAYLEGWALAATGSSLPWPVPEALTLKFVAHHLWDPARRETDPNHGMPTAAAAALRSAALLRAEGPHAPATVKRRLSHWATLHRWKGLNGPFASPALRSALRLAVRAAARPRTRKSKRAVTRDVLERLLATCDSDRLADSRDRAILLMAFGSGGRRRSEAARLRIEQLVDEAPVPADPNTPNSPFLPCLSIILGRTKTDEADDDRRVLLVGRPVEALKEWLERADITKGAVFRAIDRWDAVEERPLTPQSINLIVKRRALLAGLDPREFSAHGLRSGYLTEAARRGVALPEAMQQSQHKSVQQAAGYYNEAERHLGQAARVVI